MKKYIIGAIIVVILAISSLFYKYHTTTGKTLSVNYPVEVQKADKSPKLYLYVFFSKKNCKDCLEIIDSLNRLPPSRFIVKGVVPSNEFEGIQEVRAITGAAFPIEDDSNFKNLIPKYTPAVVGLSKKSDLFFILPGVPGGRDYLERYLYSFYQKVYSYLISIN